jgi:hypothetical protein
MGVLLKVEEIQELITYKLIVMFVEARIGVEARLVKFT